MRLGLLMRYAGLAGGPPMEHILEAERLGYHSVWCGEAYGNDAVSPIAWVLARTTKIKAGTGIMQMSARTPACAAATAATLQAMSGNRFLLGIGPSGPQVIEGWHGMPYGKPLMRTREYIEIVRKVFARQAPLEHKGEHYQIPYAGPDATRARQALEEHDAPRPEPQDLHGGLLARRAARRGRGGGRRAADLHEPGAHWSRHRACAGRHGRGAARARRLPTSTSRPSCASPWARTCRPAVMR